MYSRESRVFLMVILPESSTFGPIQVPIILISSKMTAYYSHIIL